MRFNGTLRDDQKHESPMWRGFQLDRMDVVGRSERPEWCPGRESNPYAPYAGKRRILIPLQHALRMFHKVYKRRESKQIRGLQ